PRDQPPATSDVATAATCPPARRKGDTHPPTPTPPREASAAHGRYGPEGGENHPEPSPHPVTPLPRLIPAILLELLDPVLLLEQVHHGPSPSPVIRPRCLSLVTDGLRREVFHPRRRHQHRLHTGTHALLDHRVIRTPEDELGVEPA